MTMRDDMKEFGEHYLPLRADNGTPGHDDGAPACWFVEDDAILGMADPKCIWTVHDYDGCDTHIRAGFSRMNRVANIVTQRPWDNGKEEFVLEGDPIDKRPARGPALPAERQRPRVRHHPRRAETLGDGKLGTRSSPS